MTSGWLLDTVTTPARPMMALCDGAAVVFSSPMIATVLGEKPVESGYDQVVRDGAEWQASGVTGTPDGSSFRFVDGLATESGRLRITREITVLGVGSGSGVRFGLELKVRDSGSSAADWQFFLPCTLYNRNDSDGDGVEDYLGSFDQDLRDDKNAALGVLAWSRATNRAYSLARTDRPTFDTLVTEQQMVAREFVQETDIGSLGLAPDESGGVTLRAAFPFHEVRSFSVDMSGSGWGAYAPIQVGQVFRLSYEMCSAAREDLSEAIWQLELRQMETLRTRRPTPGVSLAEAMEHRQLLTQLNYRQWSQAENPREPAGFLVHFSPRTGAVQGSLIEFGFSGDQTLVAWAQLQYGYRTGVPLYRDRARSVIDFFIRHAQLDSGFCHGIYDPVGDRFVYWFTGILMPFQYADDEAELRRYVGSQMTDALLPIARELRKVEGNYMRTMCESIFPILLAFELDAEHGQARDEWLKAGRRFGEFLLRTQRADGSWARAYSLDGEPLTQPAAWFGASDVERQSGTIFPAPTLIVLHRLTGDSRYLDAAVRAADYLIQAHVDPVMYVGGLNDTTHIKSVKTDAVGIMFLMRSLLFVLEATGEDRFLVASVKAAKVLASWVFLWDVPMPAGTLLAQAGFRSTGWAGCDVIASGSYVDDEFLEFTADFMRVAELAGDPELFRVAELVQFGMQYGLSTPDNDHGYVAPGIQCEGLLTSYWVSAPDDTEFSGAVNKLKGDDNDTCNALINAQAAYGYYGLLDRYGTDDLDQIRADLFPES